MKLLAWASVSTFGACLTNAAFLKYDVDTDDKTITMTSVENDLRRVQTEDNRQAAQMAVDIENLQHQRAKVLLQAEQIGREIAFLQSQEVDRLSTRPNRVRQEPVPQAVQGAKAAKDAQAAQAAQTAQAEQASLEAQASQAAQVKAHAKTAYRQQQDESVHKHVGQTHQEESLHKQSVVDRVASQSAQSAHTHLTSEMTSTVQGRQIDGDAVRKRRKTQDDKVVGSPFDEYMKEEDSQDQQGDESYEDSANALAGAIGWNRQEVESKADNAVKALTQAIGGKRVVGTLKAMLGGLG